MSLKVYISGPMTGFKDYNRPAFFKAEAELKERGYEVLSPAYAGFALDKQWEDYMREDIILLMQAHRIYMLEGWENSRGARIEFNLACDLKMTVMFEEFQDIKDGCCYNPQVADVNTDLIKGRYCVGCGHIYTNTEMVKVQHSMNNNSEHYVLRDKE